MIQDSKNNQQTDLNGILEQPPQHFNSQTNTVLSEFKQTYQETMAPYFIPQIQKKKIIQQMLTQRNIQFDERYFEQKFTAQLIDYTYNFQALIFRVHFGFFKMNISALIVEGTSQSHNFSNIHENPASTIFYFQDSDYKKTTIKCMHFSEFNKSIVFKLTLKEIFIQKIAQFIKAGPKFKNIFGFDAVLYHSCVQYAMECCLKVNKLDQTSIESLIKKLSHLHSFGIIHFDIKPANVMFSSQTKQVIFIDFGYSSLIRQKVGEKVWTKFRGTLQYCSDQMMKAYLSKSFQNVDLYYSDLVSLKKTFQELTMDENNLPNMEKGNVLQQTNFGSNFFDKILLYMPFFQKGQRFFHFLKIKNSMFTQSKIQVNLDNIEFLQEYYVRIIDFVKQLRVLKNYYLFYLKNNFSQVETKCQLFYFDALELKNAQRYDQLVERVNIVQNNTEIEDELNSDYKSIIKNIINAAEGQEEMLLFFADQPYKKFEWLYNKQEAEKNDINKYIRYYVDYVDFRKKLSTFSQKVEVSKIMLQVLCVNMVDFQNNQSQPFIFCLKYLFNRIIKLKQVFFEETIPILLRNLIILGGISFDEMRSMLKEIFDDRIDSHQKLMVRVNVDLIIKFIQNQNYDYFRQDIINQLRLKIQQLQVLQPYKSMIKQHENILVLCTKFHFSYTVLLSEVRKIEGYQYLPQRQIENLILYHLFYGNDSYQIPHKYAVFMFELKLTFVENYHQKYRYFFDFYNSRFLDYPNHSQRIRFRKLIYQKMVFCVEKVQFLKQFRFYYSYSFEALIQQPFQKQLSHYSDVVQYLCLLHERTQKEGSDELNLAFYLNKSNHTILSSLKYFCDLFKEKQQCLSILKKLRSIIKVDFLKKLVSSVEIHEISKRNAFSQLQHFLYTIFTLYKLLYSSQPKLSEEIKDFSCQLKEKVFKVPFQQKNYQIEYQFVCLKINFEVLREKGLFKEIIRVYQNYLRFHLQKNTNLFLNTSCFSMAFYIYLKYVFYHDYPQHLEALKFYYETILKHKNFLSIFKIEKGQLNIFYLNLYTLQTDQIRLFLDFNLELSEFLDNYSYRNCIEEYLKSIKRIKKTQIYLQNLEIAKCIDIITANKQIYLTGNCYYITLLYSFLVNKIAKTQEISSFLENFAYKMIEFIAKRVQYITTKARHFVLNQVYTFLFSNKKLNIWVTRNYSKYQEDIDLKPKMFIKAMTFKLSQSLKHSKQTYVSPMYSNLQRWYTNSYGQK